MVDRATRPGSRSRDDGYTIRRYESGDRDGMLSLYETVFGDSRGGGEWFDWKFLDNPYHPDVPIFVAEHDGEVVGARPSLPLPLTVGGERELALVQVDPMVHPDHRRRGLFTRLAAAVHDHYGPREPSVVVGFPNEAVKGGLEKLDEELSIDEGILERFPEYYRVQNPSALVDAAETDPLHRLATQLGSGVERYLATRDRLGNATAEGRVERYAGTPAPLLAEVAAHRPTPHATAMRSRQFVEWRFRNPRYSYATYVLRRSGVPVAAVVVGQQRDVGLDVVHISDALPVGGDSRRNRRLSTLLGRVVADYADADLLAAAGRTIPRSVLASHGFVGNDRFPLSQLTATYWFSARPITDRGVDGWVVNGHHLTDTDAWKLSFCELEVG